MQRHLSKTRSTPTSPNDVPLEATRWFVLLESDEATVEDGQQFQAWLASDPAHSAAFESVARLWQGLDTLSREDIAKLGQDCSSAAEAESEGQRSQLRTFNRLLEHGSPLSAKRTAFTHASFPSCHLTVAMAVLALMVTGVLSIRQSPRWYADHYTTVGEQASVTLVDGSTVQLNTDTALSVDFSSEIRRLTLHTGEAFFTVVPDPARPLEVHVAGSTIQVLGTTFNVRINTADVQVTVCQSKVRVLLEENTMSTDITAGRRLSYTRTELSNARERVDCNRATAWRQHRLIFEDRKLTDVIHELNRYRSGYIMPFGRGVEQLRVTGVFDTRDTEKALRTIEESLPVKSKQFTDLLVLLYADG